MAKAANVFRKATVELLDLQLSAVEGTVGLLIKSYRDYEASGKPSKNQGDVALAAGTHPPVVSKLETGKGIPADKHLTAILKEVGLLGSDPSQKALLTLLQFLRDQKWQLKQLKAPGGNRR